MQGRPHPRNRTYRDRRREAAALEDRHRAVAELRRVPDPHRPCDPARGAESPVSATAASSPLHLGRTRRRPVARRVQRTARGRSSRPEAIVVAARRLITERGEHFTTQELVKEAGVALQTFYRLFGGKDQLLLAVFEDLIAESCAEYEAAAAELPDPVGAHPLLRHRDRRAACADAADGDRPPLRHRRALAAPPALPRGDGTRHAALHRPGRAPAGARRPPRGCSPRRPAARRVVRDQARDGGVPPLRVLRDRPRHAHRRRRPLGVLSRALGGAPPS